MPQACRTACALGLLPQADLPAWMCGLLKKHRERRAEFIPVFLYIGTRSTGVWSSVRSASGSVQTPAKEQRQITPGKTNARSRHAAPRHASLVRWCTVLCQSRAVPCRTSLTSMTARSRTPAVNSGRSLRCSANSDNRTAQPQSPRQPSTAVVMRRTSLPSGPTSESIQIMHT